MKFFDCKRFAGVFMLLLAITCGGCTGNSGKSQNKPVTSIQQLNDPAYTIAVAGSGPAYEAVKRELPKAKNLYMNAQPAYDAVKSGKADAYVEAIVQVETAMANGLSGVKILPGKIGDPIKIAIGISKNAKYPGLKDKLNAFIAEIQTDGTFQALYQRWIIDNNHTMPDIPVPEKADTKLVVGTTGLLMPFSYYEGTTLTGTDVEIARRLARWLGAELEFKLYDYEGLITAAIVGDVDCVMSNLFVTPERADKIDFSDTLYTEDIVILVKDDAPASESVASEHKGYSSISDFNGKRIGVFTGSIHDQIVQEVLPDAERVYFEEPANAIIALNSGKIDAMTFDAQMARVVARENSTVRCFDEYLSTFDNAFIVAKSPEGDKIRAQLDEFIRSIKADGTLEKILSVWTGTDESVKVIPDYEKYPDTNGTIRIAADDTTPPFTYIKDRRLVGYEIDILARFCKAYGYRPDIDGVSFPAILPAVKSGKYLLGVASFTITEERKESVNFTEPTYIGGAMLLVKKTPEELRASQSNTPSVVQNTGTSQKYTKLADLRGKRIGIQTGTDSWARLVKKLIPDAEVLFFNDITSLAAALENGKIDAFLENNVAMAMLTAVKKNITVLDENISEGYSCAVAFRRDEKGEKLKAQWNEYITALKKDGKIDALMDKWTGPDEAAKTLPDYESFPAPNGVLVMPTDGVYPPLSYYSENTLKGFEIDLAARFCETYGYGLKIKLMSFPGMMPSIATGKCDFSVSAASVTEEHKETVMLSEPLYTYTTKIAVLASENESTAAEVNTAQEKYTSLADLNGKRIGVATGVDEWADIVHKLLPDSEVAYYDEFTDMILAMSGRKIDAFVCDVPVLDMIMQENKKIASLGVSIGGSFDVAAAFSKSDQAQKLKTQFDEFITALKNTGELDSIINKWTSAENPDKTIPEYKALPAPNGVLEMAVDSTNPPFSYYIGQNLGGFEIELAVKFCEAYGYGLKIDVMSYEAVLSALQSGKYDFALADLVPSGEHAENVLFSVPYYVSSTAIAIPADKAPSRNPETPPSSRARFTSLQDLAGKTIGVMTGTTHPQIALKHVPTAKLVYFDTFGDTMTALKTRKVDAVCTAVPFLRDMMTVDESIVPLGEQLTFMDCAPIFPKTEKGRRLCEQFSEFAKACWDNGTIKELESIWFDTEDSRRVMKDYSSLPSPNGTLRMAADVSMPPCVYMKDNRIAGYDVDFAVRFCEAYGYGLEIMPMSFAAIIPALNAGRCDFGIGTITITDERKESVLFSYPNLKTGNIFAVRKSETRTQPPKKSGTDFASLNSLSGKKIGIILGANHDIFVAEKIPDAKIEYFSDLSTITLALRNGKISAFANTLPTAIYMTNAQKDLAYISEPLESTYTYSSFTNSERGRKLCAEYEEFLRTLWADGTIDTLADKWVYSENESARIIDDYSKLPAVNGVLKMAIDTGRMPFAYVKDNRIVGYDIELAAMFCKAKGYGLEVYPLDFAGILGSIKTGKCDLTGSITWTEERAETMLYSSVPNAQTDIVLIVMNTQPAAKKPAPESASGLYTNIQDLAGKKVAVQTGTICDQITARFQPAAELVYFDTQTDLVTALKTNKADAICTDIPIAKYMMSKYSNMAMLGDPLTEDHLAPIFAKTEAGRKLCSKFTEFTKAAWENGTIQELESIWFGSDNTRRILKDYSNLPAPNGKLRMAVDPTVVPFAYMKANRIIGYDVDFAVRFCEAYGYGLEIMPMNFSGMIPAVMSGKYDLAISAIAITPERAESVLFSEPHAKSGAAFFVRKSDSQIQAALPAGQYTALEELAGKKIGVQTGTTNERLVAENIPTATREYFNTLPDALLALKTGKIDAICCSVYAARYMMIENDDITYLENMLTELDLMPIFSPTDKGRKLRDEYSEFVKGLWTNGTIQEIDSIWLGKDDTKRVIKDYTKLPAPNGVLKMASEPTDIPFVYMKDNQFVGYDVDIAVRFCESHGYGLEVVPMNFPAVISSVSSGKTDFSASMHWNQERAQSALFASVPTAHSGNVIVVMKADPDSYAGEYSSFEELAGKNIGVQTGTPNGDFTLKAIPTANVQYFDDFADIITALKMRKIDAATLALNAARFMLLDNEDLMLMGKPLVDFDAAPIFAKTEAGKKLCAQFNEFIKAQWDNGYLQGLDSIWFSRDDSKRQPTDYASLPATNGTLRMAVDLSLAPFAYVKDNKIVGYEIDFAAKFCKEYGYGLEIMPMSFGAIIAAVQSGKCDFASCTIAITPERAEQVLFASPNAKTGCALVVRKAKTKASGEKYSSINDLAGKRIGVQTGTRSPEVTKQFIPTAQLVYHDSPADNLIALRTGKIDAVSLAEVTARQMMYEYDDIAFLGERLTNVEMKPIFSKTEKGRKLCEEYSEFVKTLRDNGTLQQIESAWLGNDESRKTLRDYRKTPDMTPRGTLRMAVDTSLVPFVYVKDNLIVGYDIDIAVRFCEAKGYDLEVSPMFFSGIIPSVNTSKCDFSCSMTYTPERAENVLFASTPNAVSGTVIVVMKDKIASETVTPSQKSSSPSQSSPRQAAPSQAVPSQAAPVQPSVFAEEASPFMEDARIFFEELKASFNRTFIREERWRLFVEGIINTMIITVLSIVFGTILGFVVYLLCRGGNVFANLVTRFFIWLIEGTPIVVLLMILYYIIFGKVDIPGIWVAVIAFTMTFGAGFYGMLRSGTGALDRGQTEAAYALGFSDTQTFFTVILPQAALHFMPAYKSSVVALIKATAIVGYIAVQDLTKMGDIVRSRTYEAFFPLIAVAVIYFVLAGLLNIIVGMIHNRIRPEKRTKDDILRGIGTHD